jgi:hypothetical protein
MMQMSGPLAAYGQETWGIFEHVIDKVNAAGIPAAHRGARVARRVTAGSTDRDKTLAALKSVNFPPSDLDLYYIRPTGLSFAEDRAPNDSTGLLVQWQPDHSQQAVYPPQPVTAEPRPMQ